MVNYKNNRKRFKPNALGSLYVNEKIDNNKRPIIYIGGQMEHRCHLLEQSGKTIDSGYGMFDGSWFYDYPLFGIDKSTIDGENFAKNLISSLEMAKLADIDLVTQSYGGIIGSYASKSNRIHKVYAVHPPITGTPLANPDELLKRKELFLKREKLLLRIIQLMINYNYGFEKDNYHGIDPSKVDFNKLLVIGSSLDLDTEKDNLSKDLYNIILKYTGLESDGIVIFDEETFSRMGINYQREEESLSHFAAGSRKNLERIIKLVSQNNE